MAESDRRRVITSTPQLSPEEIVQRGFTTSFRGYSEAEVRAFLKRVSEEVVATREREIELLEAIDTLEEQLRAPRPLNEPEMLDALGAETTRLLRSAREAADEIRNKGQERAAQILEEARAVAERVGTEAEELARSRTEEAEARATELVADAEARAAEQTSATEAFATEQQARAEREAAEHVEAARQQGREMLDEAKATRERVLADLFRRRSLLQAQIDELRAGRDNLLDAYRVVKRTFLEATEALARVEARVAAERVARVPDANQTDELAEELADQVPVDEGAGDEGAGDGETEEVAATAETGTVTAADADATAPPVSNGTSGEAADAGLADVDSLFARIRAGQAEAPAEAPGEAQPETAATETVTEVQPVSDTGDASDTSDTVAAPDAAVPSEADPDAAAAGAPDAAGSETTNGEAVDAVVAWRTKRADVLDPLHLALAKRAKRTAQDDQNALLDAVRRHKGRPTSAQVLVPEADLLAGWTAVLQAAIDEAYGAGRVAAGGAPEPSGEAMVREAAESIVLPVRERIVSAIDTGAEGDTGGLVERIGARFREWRNQSLEDGLSDVLAVAWSRGVYDASPEGAVLRWIPSVEGRCADCDDNGLEPTVKGASFPTGQPHPPAHPGCRCLLAPADT